MREDNKVRVEVELSRESLEHITELSESAADVDISGLIDRLIELEWQRRQAAKHPFGMGQANSDEARNDSPSG